MNGPKEISISALKVTQPIGSFFVAVMTSDELVRIAEADIRRMELEQDSERPVEKYLGIQRPLRTDRIKEIAEYVTTADATFPTSVILAVEDESVEWDEDRQVLKLKEYAVLNDGGQETLVPLGKIASILDGQHRVKGLDGYRGPLFEVPVSIFIAADIATQANIFATVNLAQTKVSKSLVYDLFDLAKSRSPQKTCHQIAVVLDEERESPFFRRIKRLGVATEGRFFETITQATFVECLLRYISANPAKDRDVLLRKRRIPEPNIADEQKYIFRRLFINEKDESIGNIVWNYFDAIKERWPLAWDNFDRGNILNKTNGFKAFFRFMRPMYRSLGLKDAVWEAEACLSIFNRVELKDADFNSTVFLPGSSGESELFKRICADTGIAGN